MTSGAGRPGQPMPGQRSIFGTGRGPVFAQMPAYKPVTRGPEPQPQHLPEPPKPDYGGYARQGAEPQSPQMPGVSGYPSSNGAAPSYQTPSAPPRNYAAPDFPNPFPPQTYSPQPQQQPPSYQPQPQARAAARPIPDRVTSRSLRSSRAVRLRYRRAPNRRRPTSLNRAPRGPSRTPVSPIASSRRRPTLNPTLPNRGSPTRTIRMRISPTPPSPMQASPTPHIRMRASPRRRPTPTSARHRMRGSASTSPCISTMRMGPTAPNPTPTLSPIPLGTIMPRTPDRQARARCRRIRRCKPSMPSMTSRRRSRSAAPLTMRRKARRKPSTKASRPMPTSSTKASS